MYENTLGSGDKINCICILRQLIKDGHKIFCREYNNSIYENLGIKEFQPGFKYKKIIVNEQPKDDENLVDLNLKINELNINISEYNHFEYSDKELEQIKEKSNEILVAGISEIKQKSLPPTIIARTVEKIRDNGFTPIIYNIHQRHYKYPLKKIFKPDEIKKAKGHFGRSWILQMAKLKGCICIEGGAGITALANNVPTFMFMSFRKIKSTLKYFNTDLWRAVEPKVDCFPCNALADYGTTFEVYPDMCNYTGMDYPCNLYNWDMVSESIDKYLEDLKNGNFKRFF